MIWESRSAAVFPDVKRRKKPNEQMRTLSRFY